MGFDPFLTLLMLNADWTLMMALAERWSPMTYTFHLPMGEIGMPPIDFFMMMRLPMGGTPLLSIDELNLEMHRASTHRVL